MEEEFLEWMSEGQRSTEAAVGGEYRAARRGIYAYHPSFKRK